MGDSVKSGISNALELMRENLKQIVLDLGNKMYRIDEIRLRLSRPLSAVIDSESITLSEEPITRDDIEYTFKNAFSYSLHSYSKELAGGYITTEGGNRVGLCGTAVVPNQSRVMVDTLKYVSSVNIRISREIIGYAKNLYDISLKDSLSGILIIGPPSSGKTTLLRDISRICGSRYKVSLIDELNEIAYSYRGIPQMNVGTNTDVFVGYPRHIGIQTAVRVMSPQVIICDEIGTQEDYYALEYALHSGVQIISATHASNLESALKKPCINKLINANAFKYAAILDPKHKTYEVVKL